MTAQQIAAMARCERAQRTNTTVRAHRMSEISANIQETTQVLVTSNR